MSGSSRGPTDDGRIKPDIIAPGGYVRSCRAQEAQDIEGSNWQSTWYLEDIQVRQWRLQMLQVLQH